jgi:TetR/AcrR family transcriptional repressor of nem operon
MARPQEFDFEAAVDAAVAVFWERGLHRTSVDDLLSASGLARSSLYNTFGGKQALFELAVQRYLDDVSARMEETLDAPSLKQALVKMFDDVVSSHREGRGCLLVNSASSLMREDKAEQRLLRAGFERIFGILEQRLRKAQEAKELASSITPADAATLVCATWSGLCVFYKTGMQKSKIKRATDVAVKALLQQIT